MENGYLTSVALVISLLISITFLLKKGVSNLETKIFKKMLLFNFLEALSTTSIVFVALTFNSTIVLKILNRIDVILIVTWCSLMFYYIYTISTNKFNKKIKYFILVVNFIIYILALFLNVNIINENGILNSNGPLTFLGLLGASLYIIFMLIFLLFHKDKKHDLDKNKYVPLYFLLILLSIVAVCRIIIPEINLVSIVLSLITMIMVFTIENPDVKMIEELNAEKANRAKSDFLSSMSHEIRTPLNAIVGFSDCIINADNLEEAKDNAKDVVTASNTLLEIVNGILDISKIELIENDYDTQKLFNDVIKLIRVRIGDKPLDFRVSIAEDLPPVLYGDHGNVKKILINLLTNAVKYTDNGYINLNVKCVKTEQICRLIVSVKDTGRGIKKEDIAKLFTKFQRVDEDRNTTIEGTGLGLAITKQLVQMMNGNIVVNSVYGEGSEFTVAIDQRLSLAKIEVEKNDITDFNLDLTGKKILIVDDNKLNIKVAEKIIAKYNPIIDSCESGFECLEKVKINKYDLILLDDMMPKMRGSEVLVKLKEDPNFNTPVIVLTANAINGMEEQYLSKGFNGYLAKPIEKDKLFYILNKYLGNNKNQ